MPDGQPDPGDRGVRLSVATPAVVLIIASALLGLGLVETRQASAARRAETAPRTGMEILNAYACGRGETKEVLVRGVEDDFSPAGAEAGFVRPGRDNVSYLPREGTGTYDQVNTDQVLVDSFHVEGPISGGLLLLRMRDVGGGSGNDGMRLGALDRDPGAAGAWTGGGLISALRTGGVWTAEGDVLFADLEAIELSNGSGAGPGEGGPDEPAESLKDFLDQGDGGGWLDVFIQDDTAVDFMGMALCRPPPVRRGLTLWPVGPPAADHPTAVHLSCHYGRDGDHLCDPYVGDTVCSARQSVACIRPGNLPPPRDEASRALTWFWSGGDIAVTEPVRGDSFRTVGEVNAFCRQRFGDDWRVATLHDGVREQSISGRGDPTTMTDRVWVDIVDQPHGVCWARE